METTIKARQVRAGDQIKIAPADRYRHVLEVRRDGRRLIIRVDGHGQVERSPGDEVMVLR